MARILIAEDDDSMLNFLVLALKRAGHDVLPARDGNAALKALQEKPLFDLLLTDIVMPGLDGIELSGKAKNINPDIKIMFITGFAAMAMKHSNQTANKNASLLSKPFHLNDLVEEIEELLKT